MNPQAAVGRCLPSKQVPGHRPKGGRGRMTSVANIVNKFRGLESNQRLAATNAARRCPEPGVTTSSNYPGSFVSLDTTLASEVRGEGLEPPSPGSKPGSLPLADPRSLHQQGVPCGSRTRLTSLEGWDRCRSAKGTQGGRRGSRTPKAHRSSRPPLRGGARGPGAVADRLVLPHQAAVAGIEPASGRLTAAYPYQHGSHRNEVSVVGFEPTISCSRRTQNPRLSHTLKRSAQPELNRHVLHGEQGGYRYIMGALQSNQIVKDQEHRDHAARGARNRTHVTALRVRNLAVGPPVLVVFSGTGRT